MTDILAAQRNPRIFSLAVFLCIGALLCWGCAGQSMPNSAVKKGPANMIFQLTAQEALDLSQGALAQALPDQRILTLKKPRLGWLVHEVDQSGDKRYARFKETDYFYELDLLNVTGKTNQGNTISGFVYSIKGSGDLKTGPEKVSRIQQQLNAAFNRSGIAVVAISAKPVGSTMQSHRAGKPSKAATTLPATQPVETTAPAPSPKKTVAPQPTVTATPAEKAPSKPADEDVFTKLKKLKELRDQGIITEEEFQEKKQELLDRI